MDMEYKTEDLQPYIRGLYWFGQEDYEITRFPASSFPRLRPDVAFLSTNPSGGRICFRAKTSGIGIELDYPPSRRYEKFSRCGQCGVDLYMDGEFYSTFIPLQDGYFINFVKVDPASEHEFTLYLPTYATVKLLSLDVEDGEITPPSPLAIPKPIVFYGSSITQGAYASRPGLAYPAIIGRRLNAEIINLGFSGNGKGEPEVADLIAQIDASCFVMDWGANLMSPEEEGLMEERYRPLLRKVKNAHPKTPILLVGTQWVGSMPWEPRAQYFIGKIQAEIKAAYDEEVQAGNKLIDYIDGRTFVGPADADLTVDRAHVTDLGFYRYVEALVPRLKKFLHLKP